MLDGFGFEFESAVEKRECVEVRVELGCGGWSEDEA